MRDALPGVGSAWPRLPRLRLLLFFACQVLTPLEFNAATLLSEGFEGAGYENSGWTVPANSSSPPDPDYSATPLAGAQSLRCNGVSFIQRPFANDSAFYCYFQARWLAWADFKFIVDWLDAGQSSTATLFADFGRRIQIIHGGATATGTTIINDHTTYHVWVEWTRGTGADGTMRLYISTTGIKPASPEATITNGRGGAVAFFDIGPFGAGADVVYDSVLISDAPIGSNPAGNLPPSISDVANQTILRDTTLGPVSFTVNDPETPATDLAVTASSSNTGLVPNENISLGGSGGTRTVTVSPAAGQTGSTTITVSVTDGTNTAADTFLLTVSASLNTPPTITDLPNQTINQDSTLSPVSFTVGDAETSPGALVVTASSSNAALLPGGNITLSGSGATRTISASPLAGQSGSTIVTVTVSDGEASASDTFLLTVNPITGGPGTFVLDEAFEGPGYENPGWNAGTGTPNPDYASFPLQGAESLFLASGSSINRSFSLTTQFGLYCRARWPDAFTQFTSMFQWWTPFFGAQVAGVATEFGDRLQITHGTTAATAVIPTISPNTTYHVWIEWSRNSGAGDGTMQLYISTDSNKPGTPQASLSGGTGTDPGILVVGPYAGGNGMIIDTLLVADSPIGSHPGGNSPPGISDIANQTILPGATLGPISFTINDAETPAADLLVTAGSSNTGLVPNENISLGGAGGTRTITIVPAAGQTGAATITVSVSDSTNTTADTFLLTVSSGESDPGTFVLDEAFEGPGYENPGWNTGTGTPDPDYSSFPLQDAESLFLASGSSINRVFALPSQFNLYARVRWPDSFVQFSSLFQWWTPFFGAQVAGVGTEFGDRLAITHGTAAATAVIPTILPNTTYHVWVEWSQSTGAADGMMRLFISPDGEKPTAPQASLNNGLGVNASLLVVGPYAGGNGMIVDTLLVSDTPIGSHPSANTPPTISTIAPQTTPEDTATGAIPFTIGDLETPADNLTLGANSSNLSLVPTANILFGGSGSSRTVAVTPAPDQYGSADITITVSDGQLTASTTFTLSVTSFPDNPVITWAAPAPMVYGALLGGGQLNAVADVPGTFSYTPAAGTALNAGNGQLLSVTFTPDDAVNYTTATASVTVDVLRAPLTIAAVDQTRIYGAANPPLTATYSGFVNGDTPASLDSPVTLTTSANPGSSAGVYPIVSGGASDANYDITHISGALTVTPWQHQDIGAVGLAGTATDANDTYTVTASGVDIWDQADGFHFVYRPWEGNGEIIVRVTSVGNTDPWAKAGVMFRETLATDSRHAMMVVTPGNGSAFQRRLSTGGYSTHTPGPSVTAPYWVRLLRIGDAFQGYISPDGATWTLVGSDTVPMAASLYVGLAVTAHNNGVRNTSTFSNVETRVPIVPPTLTITSPTNGTTLFTPANVSIAADVTPNGQTIGKVQFFGNGLLLGEDSAPPYSFAWSNVPSGRYVLTARTAYGDGLLAVSPPVTLSVISPLPAPWQHQDVGAVALGGDATHSNGVFAVTGSGTDIWDLADGFHYVYQRWTGSGEIIARVLSVGNTDPWAKAGVMFRESLAADSRHAMMVVTPGNGSAFQRRLTPGGVSTHTAGRTVTTPYWVRLLKIGNLVQGYISADGTTWSLVGSDTVPMTDPIYIGLVVTAHNNTVLNTSTFTNVQLRELIPTVAITSPANGAQFLAPASVTVAANVVSNGYAIAAVQFFANGTLLGQDTTPPYSHTQTGIVAGNYALTARAVFGADRGATSAPVNVSVVSLPAAPTRLTATAASSSQINLSWVAGSANQTGFRIERSANGITYTQIATTAAGVTSFNNTGLSANTLYYYRVRATNALGNSPYSPVASATTFLPLVRINFQPASSSVPSGYLVDSGSTFGSRGNGYSYGWNANNSSTARDRNSSRSPDQRYDTLQHMQLAASTWDIAVPNGAYSVFLVAGDPSNFDSTYRINVEGVLTVSGNPNGGTRWFSGTKTVTVSDGRLTVSNGTGAANNKVCFIEITQVPPPQLLFEAASALVAAPDEPVRIQWLGRDAWGRVSLSLAGGVDGVWEIESSTDLKTWEPFEVVPGTDGVMTFESANLDGQPNRFFRAVRR